MEPSVYSLGATLLVAVAGDEADDLFFEAASRAPVALVPARVVDHLTGLNMLRDGDFSAGLHYWQAEGSDGIESGVDLADDWRLANGHTGYLRLSPGVSGRGARYTDPQYGDMLPILGGHDYLFSGHFAAHRGVLVLTVEYFDAGKEPVALYEERVLEAKTGGAKLAQYDHVGLHCFAPEKACFVRLTISLEAESAAEDCYAFFSFLSFSMSAGKLARGWADTPADLFGLCDALGRKGWILAAPEAPLVRGQGTAEYRLTCRGETVAEGLSVEAHPFKCRGLMVRGRRFGADIHLEDKGSFVDLLNDAARPTALGMQVLVDGKLDAIGFAHKSKSPDMRSVYLRLGSGHYDGRAHHIVLRTFEGQVVKEDVQVLAPYSIDFEVVRAHSKPPYRSELSALSGTRFRSLQAHMARAATLGAEEIGQIGTCLDIVSTGFENNKIFVPLTFPRHDKPTVSVVMPVHNKFEVTYNGLAALKLAYNDASFEVIVVDDGSSDRTRELGDLVSGITTIRHEVAQGFVGACNAGAAAARGDYIVLLNNDTEVTFRWLDELLFAFRQFKDVGLVGSKLIYPNGNLQEAGGIIWAEGEGWNYGRHCNAFEPRYNYTRPVHYCSGAAIMVARDVWQEVGGFSAEFAPAYYEDTDLAFKIRDKGYKTLCAPLSEVVHFEGISNGTEVVSTGLKRYQEINKPKFYKKWASVIDGSPEPGEIAHLFKDEGVTRRALFIDYQVPRTDYDAGSYAAIQEMRLIQSLGYKVTFIPANLAWLGKYVEQMQRIGIEVIYAPFFAAVDEFMQERGSEFDVIYLTRYYVAQDHMDMIREFAPQAKVLFNNADLHFLREARAAIQSGDPEALEEARKTRDDELAVMREVDLTLSYNEVEHAVILSHNMEQSRVMKAPWVVDIADGVPAYAEREGIAFLGGYGHPPNVEAMRYFVREVMPVLRERLPGVPLYIYGSNMNEDVASLAADDVIVVGHVEDVADVYNQHRLFIAPLLSGAGIKGKVIAAMAHGIPTVLSSIAAEGTGARHGYDCHIVDTAEGWAASLSALYGDEAAWQLVSTRSREFVASQFSFDRARQDMMNALKAVGSPYAEKPEGLYIQSASMNLEP